MNKIETSSSKEQSNRTGTRTIRFVLAFSVAALTVSGAVYGAKPVPSLNATVCQSISGVWASPTCTIPAGIDGVASTDFRITRTNVLDVKGTLTINTGVTISNAGTITVENEGGVIPEFPPPSDDSLAAGVLILGTLDNSGTITIGNVTDSTAGIVVSVLLNLSDPFKPSFVPGVLTNSGTITIQNAGFLSQGINNLGVLNNSASGIITIANSSNSSTGIRNARYGISGTITNAGSMTLANTGDGDGRGLSNAGSFTNAATGTFTINPSTVTDVLTFGMRNNGTFTNFGTFINNRGSYDVAIPANSTWGSYNISPGAMMNYGRTSVGTATDGSGTFYTELMMLNFGEITSYGVMYDYGGIMVNYGTIYNYGLIVGGANVGICIDEPGAPGGC